MCRQMAYVGPPVPLESLVLAPEHSLLHQSYEPKHQRNGTVNADGFGCGWFDTGVRPEPALYRRSVPIWSDRSFRSMAGLIRTKAFVAAVRDATTGSFLEESSTPPFSQDGWLFAHNGKFGAFDGPPGVRLRRQVSDRRLAAIRGTSDSEYLLALILDRVDEGMAVRDAMGAVIAACLEMTTGTFNFLMHDGWKFTATACGDSLFVLEGSDRLPGAVVAASEPYDDDPAWQPVPDGSVVEGYCGGVVVAPLRGTS
jgi:gamma-glutamyl hercynylcysteine S-oxide hydrolase